MIRCFTILERDTEKIVEFNNTSEYYSHEEFRHKLYDTGSDNYEIVLRSNRDTNDYQFQIIQQATGPFRGNSVCMLSLDEWKHFERHLINIRHELKDIDLNPLQNLKKQHIAGTIYMDIRHYGDRGPAVLLNMGVYNTTNFKVERDIFGAVLLDVGAIEQLKPIATEINLKFPIVAQHQVCLDKHRTKSDVKLCRVCQPWGYRFK